MSNQLIRNILRGLAAFVLLIIAIFRLVIPYIVNDGGIYLDKNDGYVVAGCVALLLSIEAIKRAVDSYLASKSKNNEK